MTQEVKILVGISLVTFLLIAGGVYLMSRTPSTPAVDQNLLTRNANHQIKVENSKVTIVEFADFQCPACGAVHPTVNRILEDYKGKISFIYRHFPLPQHQNAILAAQVAEAAGAQGQFWQMSDQLYGHQGEWSESTKALDMFIGYAKTLNLDTAKFTKDATSGDYQNAIITDRTDGTSLGVNSTPTFYINDQKLLDAPSYDNIKNRIDELLK